MSGTNNLSVNITARDTASAQISVLQRSIKALEDEIFRVSRSGIDQGNRYTQVLKGEITAVQAQIAALREQAAAINNVTAAMQKQGNAAGVVHRNLSQQLSASFGADTSRQINSAAASAALMQRETRHLVALFDELSRGQRGSMFSTIGAAARDAGFGVAALATSVGILSTVMIAGSILHGAKALGEWASNARAAASATGMSLENYTRLQGAMVLTGHKIDEADSTLRHLAQSMSTALTDPASLAAQAFHNLGITQDTLRANGQDLHGVVLLLAEAFKNSADGVNKTANMTEIAGRGFQKLIPLIQDGKVRTQEYEAESDKLGMTLNDKTANALEHAGEAVDHLSGKIRGEGIQAMAAWAPAIENIISLLGRLLQAAGYVATAIAQLPQNVATVHSALSSLNNIPGGANTFQSYLPDQTARDMFDPATGKRIRKLSGRAGGAGAPSGGPTISIGPIGETDVSAPKFDVPPLVKGGEETVHSRIMREMAQAAKEAADKSTSSRQASMAVNQAEIGVLQKLLSTEKLSATDRDRYETELAQKQRSLRMEQLSAGGAASKQGERDFAALERLKIAEAEGSSKKIIAIYDEWIAQAKAKYGEFNAEVLKLERERAIAVTKAKMEELKEGTKQEEQLMRLARLNGELASIASGKMKFAGQDPGPKAEEERAKQLLKEAQEVFQRGTQRIGTLQSIRDEAPEGTSVRREASQEILAVETQMKEKLVTIYREAGAAAVEAAKKANAAFKSFFDGIGSHLEGFTSSVIKSLIAPQVDLIKAGLTTVKVSMQGNEIRSAAKTMLLGIAGDLGKSIETAVGRTLANALSGGAANTVGELLSNLLGKAFASITGQTFSSMIGNILGSSAGNALGGAAGGVAGAAVGGAETVGAIAASTTAITGATGVSTTAIVAAITASSAEMVAATIVGHPSIAGFSLAGGGIIPSAAGGMTVGGNGATLAVLHAREMVLPAPISEGIQQMIARGGSSTSNNNSAMLNYSPTINANSRGRNGNGMTRGELAAMMSQHGGAMLGEARNMMRAGWRPA